jgi:DNA polymerase I-like protein with 3'-5' exonuclease and polymerase domains
MKNEQFLTSTRSSLTGKTVVALDTETYLIGPEAISPKVVCVSLANREDASTVDSDLLAAHRWETLHILKSLLTNDEVALVGHNMAYDLCCIRETWPELTMLIWDKLAKGLVTDTMIREKLLNLSQYGDIEFIPLPDGQTKRLLYNLNALGSKYLGIDRSDEKEGDDIWRLRYNELDGKEIEDYPEEARTYAIDDAIETLLVYEAQDKRCTADRGPGSMNTHTFQTAIDYALRRMTGNGVRIDREKRDALQAELDEQLCEENQPLLIKSGILRPAVPSRPHSNQKKKLKAMFPDMEDLASVDWAPIREELEEQGIRFTKPKKASRDTTILASVIEAVCEEHGIEVRKTASGKTASDGAFLKEIAHLDPILQEYQARMELARLAGTELPRLDAERVHPNFDILKETGRTSSYGNSKNRPALYPSTNIQQVDPRARGVFIPDPGCVFASVDYSSLELVSTAQKTYSLFGYSVHRDKVLAGCDLHAFLGSQLAFALDPGFGDACADCTTADEVYEKFIAKKNGTDEEQDFFEHWRKFAKPTGLGYPGGLGAKTFITYAAGIYDVHVDQDTAERLKEIWLATYPEMVDYFDWINKHCVDPEDPDAYCYETPLGMWRAKATYCAAANGACMQSPSAEGAKLATFRLMRACDDPEDLLHGCKGWAFIHDEVMVQIPEDRFMSARAERVGAILEGAMGAVFPDVPIEAEPALMRRWDKKAKTEYDSNKNLVVWEPKEKK